MVSLALSCPSHHVCHGRHQYPSCTTSFPTVNIGNCGVFQYHFGTWSFLIIRTNEFGPFRVIKLCVRQEKVSNTMLPTTTSKFIDSLSCTKASTRVVIKPSTIISPLLALTTFSRCDIMKLVVLILKLLKIQWRKYNSFTPSLSVLSSLPKIVCAKTF